jgi:hypothetical protein
MAVRTCKTAMTLLDNFAYSAPVGLNGNQHGDAAMEGKIDATAQSTGSASLRREARTLNLAWRRAKARGLTHTPVGIASRIVGTLDSFGRTCRA